MAKSNWQLEQERAIAAVRRRIDRMEDRPAENRPARNVRLAVTVRDEYGNYPTRAECPNTYWIIFVDGSYPAAAGRQAEDLTLRQPLDEPRTLAHNIVDGDDAYCELYTLITVSWHTCTKGSQWWFYHCCRSSCSSSWSSDSAPSSSSAPDSSAPESSAPDSSAPSSAPDSSAPSSAPDSSAPSSAPDSSAPDSSAPDSSAPSSSPDSSAPESSAPDSGEPPASSGQPEYIDVVVCEPFLNDYCELIFPQKRIWLPAGTLVEDLPDTEIPLEC